MVYGYNADCQQPSTCTDASLSVQTFPSDYYPPAAIGIVATGQGCSQWNEVSDSHFDYNGYWYDNPLIAYFHPTNGFITLPCDYFGLTVTSGTNG